MSASVCSVLPRPMWSARMAPVCAAPLAAPMTDRKRKTTPSRWCGRSIAVSHASTHTGAPVGPSPSTSSPAALIVAAAADGPPPRGCASASARWWPPRAASVEGVVAAVGPARCGVDCIAMAGAPHAEEPPPVCEGPRAVVNGLRLQFGSSSADEAAAQLQEAAGSGAAAGGA